jgi:formylglycine-generating enzyme required for sulfatase activity
MKRKQIILAASAATLLAVVALGIAGWWLLMPEPPLSQTPTGLSAPIELVEIPTGEFLMGSPEDEEGRCWSGIQHLVRITCAFKMGKYEVSQKQWKEVMGTGIKQQRDKIEKLHDPRPSLFTRIKRLPDLIIENRGDPISAWKGTNWIMPLPPLPMSGQDDEHPMYYVCWEDAMDFCKRLSDQERVTGRLPDGYEYRLPSEAEWEYACRAGSTTRFANGDTEDDLAAMGWYHGNAGRTNPIGMKRPNAWNLYDMHGNVQEWCLGESLWTFGPNLSAPGRISRGGGWRDSHSACRSANIRVNARLETNSHTGFRVILAPVRPR